MGASSQPFLVSLSLKDHLLQGTEENNNSSYGYLWRKVMASRKVSKKSVKSRRQGTILMKRRARLMEGSRRRANKIERRVRTLKRLIPNGESMGLDGLFRETADYILTLQMRVRVMQTMFKVLTGSDE